MPVISLFVSSTFRDFHAERDLLVGLIRAELDERIAQYGCRVEVIDLRWGLGQAEELDEAVMQERTLSVCLDEIDRARPLFVGLLGDRYGWVPPPERVNRAMTQARWTAGVADGWSVTALEFEHGAFRRDQDRPAFFIRDLVGPPPPGWVDEDRRAVAALRARVEGETRAIVHSYRAEADGVRVTDLSDFERVVLNTLGPLVEARAQQMAAGEVDPVRAAERLFIEARTTVVGRDDQVAQLRTLMAQRRSVCLFGASGVGKSTLWCAAAELAPPTRLASVVVGVSPGTTGLADVIGRLARQFGLEPPEVDADALVRWWRATLAGLGEVLVAVDGADSLDADAIDLRWLTNLPPFVQVLVSTTDARQAGSLTKQGTVECLAIGELDSHGVSAMLAALADELRRTLPAEVVSLLAERPRSPLWVRLAFMDLTGLDESDFAQVSDPTEVARLLVAAASDLPDGENGLVAALCDRVEASNPGAVAPIVTLLSRSRSGLTTLALAELTGLEPVVIARVRRAFAGLIAARGAGGQIGFTHGVIRNAVAIHFPTDATTEHARLAHHHAGRTDVDAIGAADALWHALLAGGGAADLLDGLLSGVEFPSPEAIDAARVLTSVAVDDLSTVLDCTAQAGLTSNALDYFAWYLTNWCPNRLDTERWAQLAAVVHSVAAQLAEADPSDTQAQRDLSIALGTVGDVALRRGELDAAETAFREALIIDRRSIRLESAGAWRARWRRRRTRSSDAEAQRDLAVSLGRVGDVALRRGELDAAEAAFREALDLDRRMVAVDPTDTQAQRDLAVSLGRVGDVALRRGELDAAEAAFREALDLDRRMVAVDPTDTQAQRDLSVSLDTVGDVALRRGELDAAEAAFREALLIERRLAGEDPSDT
jgi:tetratricopeptide (TPR) repeat protein